MTWGGWALSVAVGVSLSSGAPAAAQRERAEAYYHFVLARQLDSQGNTDGAAAELREAARLDPSAAEIRAELAALYARQEDAEEAGKWAEAALALDTANREAHRVLGLVAASAAGLQEGGRVSDAASLAAAVRAVEHLEAARRTDRFPDFSIDLTLARLYLRTGAPEKAVPVILRLLNIDPGRTGLEVMLAEAYHASGQLEPAAGALQRAVGQRPRDSALLDRLGDVLFRLGRYAAARGAWERALLGDGERVDRAGIERKILEAQQKEASR